jgi:membrane associated rhomboid family serine protease
VEILSAIAALTIPAAVGYAAWRKAPLSLTLAVAMLATFGLGIVASRLYPYGGLFRFWDDLAVWKIPGSHSGPLTYLTMMFVHADLFHILFNLLFLILIGPLLEERIGSLRWGVLFFAGGLVATVAYEAIHFQDPGYGLLGASGALSAVFGAFGRLYPREKLSVWLPIPLPPMPVIYYVIGFVAVQFLLSLLPFGGPLSGIAWEAHVAGLAFGFAAAPLVMRIPSRKTSERVRDFSALRTLAKRPELEEILGHLSKEPLREAQVAWLEKFAAKASCPQCGRPLRFRRSALRSECGWKLRVP